MEKQIITFSANEQCLQKTGGVDCYASNTVAYIEAHFDLGTNWSGYDSVRAVWFTDFVSGISTVLDSDGVCIVPHEVLTRKSAVKVNLVGSIADGDVLTDRLTTCPVTAVAVKCNAKVTGANSTPITPSEYEQFVQNVKADADRAEAGATAAEQSAVNANASADEAEASAQNASESASASAISASDSARSATASAESAQNASESAQNAENAKDDAESARDKILSMRATASTLPAGSDATASYSDGLLSLGIPKGDKGDTGAKGDKGDTGATPNFSIGTVSTLEPNTDATATITGTAEEPILNLGIPKGEQGDVNLSQLEALLPTDTASGDIASITDGQSVVPVKSLKVTLEPIQSGSGTPSPSNPRPISGHTECVTERCGENVWDEEWEVYASRQIKGKNPIPLIAGATYYIKSPTAMNLYVKEYIGGSNIDVFGGNNRTYTVPSNGHYAYLYTGSDYGATYNHDISINYPSTDHEYRAYAGHTYTTNLGRTVYGGTLDVVSGELVVDRAMVDLGTLTWSRVSGVNSAFRTYISDMYQSKANDYADILCSQYPYNSIKGHTSQSNVLAVISDGTYMVVYDATYLYIRNDSYSDATDFKTAMDGVQLVYELSTPQTIQLTPQEVQLLLGTNNVWSDGNVTLVYSADIQKWVEKKLNANSTTSMLTMSRPMVQTETTETEETETETAETE